jgi:hypothetical protein
MMTALLLLRTVLVPAVLCAAAFVYSQCGFGYSGLIRANPLRATITMAAYRGWPSTVASVGNAAFNGGMFDGQSVWLVPQAANAAVAIDVRSGAMTAYDAWPSGASGGFVGGIFDGTSAWLVPYTATKVVRINISSGAMTAYSAWPSGVQTVGNNAFGGGVYDGHSVWLSPGGANAVVRITGQQMTAYTS